MRVLVGAPVRQEPRVFVRYLEGLRSLEVPNSVELDFCFVLHNSEDLSRLLIAGESYAVCNDNDGEYVVDNHTHHWTTPLIAKVGAMKNALLRKAVEEGYDYFWLVDSDLVIHPLTLHQLLSAQKDLIAEVFWTKWTPDTPEMPNAWDFDHYGFHPDSPEKWRKPGVYQVGMTGACFLIHRRVLESGVDYSPVPNLSFWGEDRHFCVRAAVHGYTVWLDTTYPARHLYRRGDWREGKK